jgi:hypothetical protein
VSELRARQAVHLLAPDARTLPGVRAQELVFAAVFVGVILLTWPTPPWKILQYGGIALMVIAPFAFFPFSKTLFLAFDLLFRPAAPDELADPARARLH